MTERLSALLHEETAALDVPPVDHASIRRRGQKARSRRRMTTLVAAAAAVAVVGTGAVFAVNALGDDAKDGANVAGAEANGLLAYGAGSTVVVGDATASIPDTLHSLHYSSVGVLTRSNPNDGASDGSGPESLTLIAPDGTTTDLGTIPAGVGPATDPDESVYALAEKSGDTFRAVIRDARTGDEVGHVALPDLPMSYWDVPPLALDGDVVYAGFKKEAVAFNWRTGKRQPAEGLSGGIPEVYGGRALIEQRSGVRVLDVATGDTVLEVEPDSGVSGTASLSPDGRYLRFTNSPTREQVENHESPGVDIHDLSTGTQVHVADQDMWRWGWSVNGYSFDVSGKTVTECSPTTGECTDHTGPAIGQGLRLGGQIYES